MQTLSATSPHEATSTVNKPALGKVYHDVCRSLLDIRASKSNTQLYAATVNGDTLLGTAQVVAVNAVGDTLMFRALINPASEGSFITERAVQSLSLRKSFKPLSITGVGGYVSATTKAIVSVTLRSIRFSKHSVSFSAAVLPKLSSLLPKSPLKDYQWQHIKGLDLADPTFATPAPVDCLIGADIYPEIVRDGLQRGPVGSPIAQNTILGWVLIGPVNSNSSRDVLPRTVESYNTTISPLDSLEEKLHKFWEIEELFNPPPLTPAEDECETHFLSSHYRDESGRFVVRLPFESEPHSPGSKLIAKQRLLSLERRLQKDSSLREDYSLFMNQYERVRHMKRSPDSSLSEEASYLPHRAVVTQHGATKKLRVDFNASQLASNAKSLNDFLHIGPKLQQDIRTILLRWRFGRIAFTADIVKMFRQIRVHATDTRWQRILWRNFPEEPMQAFDLTTVTYGTACAPYLALRALRQLALDGQHRFPIGSQILREHMYVDDALVSTDTEAEVLEAKSSLVGLLSTARMELDKWASNCPALLANDQILAIADRRFDKDLSVSTLGLRWTPATDTFSYQAFTAQHIHIITKRHLLSEVAQIYDPMGWISPITVRAKLLIQRLWLLGNDWDTPADAATTRVWLETRAQLSELQTLAIPRWFDTTKKSAFILHGFFDAFEKVYAAVIYLVNSDKKTVWILAAKSKVAPIKAVSLPRLELCGALLLTRLMANIRTDLAMPELRYHCWTDSEVVLAWLPAPPCTWNTFVANRVGEIRSLLPTARWAHVSSKHNPADVASRGCTPIQLRENTMWWHGPPWLSLPHEFPQQKDSTILTR